MTSEAPTPAPVNPPPPSEPVSPRDLDGGMASRKLWLAVLTQLLIVGVCALAGVFPVLVPMLSTICGSLIGALAIYVGGNVGTRWVHKDTIAPP